MHMHMCMCIHESWRGPSSFGLRSTLPPESRVAAHLDVQQRDLALCGQLDLGRVHHRLRQRGLAQLVLRRLAHLQV